MARSLADWGRTFFSRERSTSAPSRRSRRKSHRAGNPLAPQYVYRASLEPLEERQLLAVDAEFVFDIDTNPSPVAPLKTSPPVQVGSWLYFAGSYPTSGNELWRVNVASSSAELVHDIRAGTANGFQEPPFPGCRPCYTNLVPATHRPHRTCCTRPSQGE